MKVKIISFPSTELPKLSIGDDEKSSGTSQAVTIQRPRAYYIPSFPFATRPADEEVNNETNTSSNNIVTAQVRS